MLLELRPLLMAPITLLLACVACAAHGDILPATSIKGSIDPSSQLNALSTILLAFSNQGAGNARGKCTGVRSASRSAVHLAASDSSGPPETLLLSRRSALLSVPTMLVPFLAQAAAAPALDFKTSSNGLQWADATAGSGSAFQTGQRVQIDYVMSTTGARYGSKIDSTKDRQDPYGWTLGDGTTILGLEQAILGGDGVPPMLPGGVRRVIVPAELAYKDLPKTKECSPASGRGPIPPNAPQKEGDLGAGEYQRFKNIYCNPERPYQPNLVLDIKLYGKRN